VGRAVGRGGEGPDKNKSSYRAKKGKVETQGGEASMVKREGKKVYEEIPNSRGRKVELVLSKKKGGAERGFKRRH